jgi:hypothetical protein
VLRTVQPEGRRNAASAAQVLPCHQFSADSSLLAQLCSVGYVRAMSYRCLLRIGVPSLELRSLVVGLRRRVGQPNFVRVDSALLCSKRSKQLASVRLGWMQSRFCVVVSTESHALKHIPTTRDSEVGALPPEWRRQS